MSRGRNTESGAAHRAGKATEAVRESALPGTGPWSARRKVTVVTLTGWRDAFLEGGDDGLKSRTGEATAVEHVKDWLAPRPTALTGEARIRRDERLRSRRIRQPAFLTSCLLQRRIHPPGTPPDALDPARRTRRYAPGAGNAP